MELESNNKTNNTNKYTNFTVIDPKYITPGWDAGGIFQTWQPISGYYDTSSNFCNNNNNKVPKLVSNQTGRGFTGNNQGFIFSDEIVNHVEPGYQYNDNKIQHGKLYAHQIGNLTTISPPQDRVFRPYKRIGYSYRN